ncbi:MAG: HEPN domain-containing protein [Alistipes indistinctus]
MRTISLVYILYSPKNHDLDELIRSCKAYTTELCKAFPRNTPEEERLFKLLQRAYIESRYNPDFEITKADIDALVPKVEHLRDITEKVCKRQIEYYKSRISEKSE